MTMEELKDLQQMAQTAVARFEAYDGKDFVLPQEFKDKVKSINSNSLTYNKYSAIIETSGNQNGILNIYLPNQWFYIASYFTEYYNEIQKYKKYALEVTSKERLKVLNGNTLNSSELKSLHSLAISEQSKSNLLKFITDYTWWGGAKTIDRGDFFVSPILSHARLVNASQSFVADLCAFLADKQDLVETIIKGEANEEINHTVSPTPNPSFQQIVYGAPGTGKSHQVKKETKAWEEKGRVIRTTFHPDSDYSTFVGAYKPTTNNVVRYDIYNNPVIRDGEEVKEQIITYEFIPQAFIQAYIDAWKNREEPEYLIIEEINRGNCAQIFGDLFQLLDRDDNGFSEYTIKANKDLQKYLSEVFSNTDINDFPKIKSGEELLLPNNLFIRATMNTSDQSLFPIDSAFKRRWDWEYEPIKYKNINWVIDIEGEKYYWTSFQKEVNQRILNNTNSEDKMLGDYFVNPKDGIITEKMLLNKILFYLWNDVCKDGEGDIFKTSETDEVSFSELYGEDGRQKLMDMMEYLKVEKVEEDDFEDLENDKSQTSTKYSINGENKDENGKDFGKGTVVKRAVEIYCLNNPDLSAEEVRDNWKEVGFKIPHIVETEEDMQQRLNGSKDKTRRSRAKEVKLRNGESIYVSTEVGNDKLYNRFDDFLSRIQNKPEWKIFIQQI